MAGSGVEHGSSGQNSGELGTERRRELHGAAGRFLDDLEPAALIGRNPVRLGRDALDDRGGSDIVRVPKVEPEVDARGDHVGAARHRAEPSDSRTTVCIRGSGVAHRHHDARGGDHRVASVGHEGGASVIALPGDRDAPPAVAEDGTRDPHRLPEIDETTALLDVQFNKGADRREGGTIPANETGIDSARGGDLGEAGDTAPVVIDRLTGEIRKAQIFVAVLGALCAAVTKSSTGAAAICGRGGVKSSQW